MFALNIDSTVLRCGVFVAAHCITVLIGQLAADVALRLPCGGTGAWQMRRTVSPYEGNPLLMW